MKEELGERFWDARIAVNKAIDRLRLDDDSDLGDQLEEVAVLLRDQHVRHRERMAP